MNYYISMMAILPIASSSTATDAAALFAALVPYVLSWGWFLIIFLTLWIMWQSYKILKMSDYVSAIEWTYLQITLPELAEQTPKAMEVAFDVWGGIHKNPDVIEKYFDGYLEAWYSCEIQCSMNSARYIMVVPTVHRRFFEGVIYGQYPTAEIREVEDYSQKFQWQGLNKDFAMYGTEMVLVEDDIYPIRTYSEYEDKLAPEDRFIDPHQSLIEAYTNVGPGEEYWVQICIRPVDASVIQKWSDKGSAAIAEISGQAKSKPPGMLEQFRSWVTSLPGELFNAFLYGAQEAGGSDDKPQLRFFNPVDDAKMKGILQKTSKSGYKTKIRVVYIAPAGQLHKPNISRAIGAFKQFNTFHLNSLKPDSATKTNGPNLFMKAKRRAFRERNMLLNYQWRDFWGADSGQMFTAEELATLYHFPVKYLKAPGIERAKAGLQNAPSNLPYV